MRKNASASSSDGERSGIATAGHLLLGRGTVVLLGRGTVVVVDDGIARGATASRAGFGRDDDRRGRPAPFGVVGFVQLVMGATGGDQRKLPTEIDRIGDAGVHPLVAGGAEGVRRVAGQQDAARPEAPGDGSAHPIAADVVRPPERERTGARAAFAEHELQLFGRGDRRVALGRRRVPPQVVGQRAEYLLPDASLEVFEGDGHFAGCTRAPAVLGWLMERAEVMVP